MTKTKLETFPERVLALLTLEERSNRWLIGKLKEEGVELTDTQISNRLKDIHPFRENEIVAICKLFKMKR